MKKTIKTSLMMVLAIMSFSNTKAQIHEDQTTGNIGIGTTKTTDYKLSVEGKVRAREVRINMDTWADYVFNDSFCLTPIGEVETYIAANNHLPGVPDASTIEQTGVEVGAMQKLMMQKIEELTLYVIKLNKEIEILKKNTSPPLQKAGKLLSVTEKKINPAPVVTTKVKKKKTVVKTNITPNRSTQ